MTREEAATRLSMIFANCDTEMCRGYVCRYCDEAINMAIEALQQEPNEDLISRKDAIDEMGYCQTYLFDARDKDKKISLEDVLYALEQLPSAQPKRGKWKQAEDIEKEYAVCTNCKHHGEFYMSYCPNCGAKMESDGE